MIGREMLVEVVSIDTDGLSAELVIRGRSVGGNGRGSSRPTGNSLLLHRDEACQPGAGISVTLVDVRIGDHGPKVRLGIDAPPHMAVHRREVFEAIEAENRRSSPPGE